MKECPKCLACYEAVVDKCPIDNTILEEGMVGSTILAGKFRIESRLGKGGMGTVYRAMHLGLKRYVAIKILQDKQNKGGFLERFRREAEAIGQIKHPNVIDVMDFGFVEIDKQIVAYLVMEFLEGHTLRNLISEKGKLSLEDAVGIMEQVCKAVDAAHNLGIIHRDLKPENIYLEEDSSAGYKVKVLDFGLAKLTNRQSLDPKDKQTVVDKETTNTISDESDEESVISSVNNSPTFLVELKGQADQLTSKKNLSDSIKKAYQTKTNRRLQTGELIKFETDFFQDNINEVTRTGAMIGTLPYMSPEQCIAIPITNASDIYSLGIIAYEMLTGARPFLAKGFDLAVQHLNDEAPPLRNSLPDIPKQVEDAVLCALAKEPELRPQSAMEFFNLFSSYLTEKQRKKARLHTIMRWSIAISALCLMISTIVGSRSLIKEYYYQAISNLGGDKIQKVIKGHSIVKLINTVTEQETILVTTQPEVISSFTLAQGIPTRFNARFSKDGQLAVLYWVNENTTQIEIWDVVKAKKLYEISKDIMPDRFRSVEFSSDSKYIVLSAFNKISIVESETGKLVNQIVTYERNDYLQISSNTPNLLMLGSLRKPIVEHRLATTSYPLDATSSLLSIWDINNNRKNLDLSQQFGEIEFIYASSSKINDLVLVQWRVAEQEPSRYIEVWDFKGVLKEKWQVTGVGGGAISPDGNKVALQLSPLHIVEFDLNLKKQIQEYDLQATSHLEKISYDQDGMLSIITDDYIKELTTGKYFYKPPAKVAVIDWAKSTNMVLVETSVFQ